MSDIDRALSRSNREIHRERLARSVATYLRDQDWQQVYASLGVSLPLAYLMDVAYEAVDRVDLTAWERAERLRENPPAPR